MARTKPTQPLQVTLAEQERIALARSAPNPNTNCLEGMKCPNWSCDKPYGPLLIEVTISVRFTDEGSEDQGFDYGWTARSRCECENCGFKATVKAFTDTAPKPRCGGGK
jgi:hypothetical protein